jgi:hypothetical protein
MVSLSPFRFAQGFSDLSVLSTLRQNAWVMLVALEEREKTTADMVIALFSDVVYSEKGSNRRL